MHGGLKRAARGDERPQGGLPCYGSAFFFLRLGSIKKSPVLRISLPIIMAYHIWDLSATPTLRLNTFPAIVTAEFTSGLSTFFPAAEALTAIGACGHEPSLAARALGSGPVPCRH